MNERMNERMNVCSLTTANEMKSTGLPQRPGSSLSGYFLLSRPESAGEKRREGFDLEEWTISGLQHGQGCDLYQAYIDY